MQRVFILWMIGVSLAALPGCGPAVRAPVGDRSERPAWVPKTHRVRPGDTLYSIAWQYGMDDEQLARWNAIRPPYTIVVGQTLYLYPRNTGASASRKPATSTSSNTLNKPKTHAVTKSSSESVSQPQGGVVGSTAAIRWQWPVQGKLLRTFQANSPGKKGIDIAGVAGRPVRAAASGRVVYSGSGLVGYGRLIIIKHNKNFLSAYGHNQKLFAQQGTEVHAGQVIAEMGNSGTNRVQLHFEIRKDGKPVDPLGYLPRQ